MAILLPFMLTYLMLTNEKYKTFYDLDGYAVMNHYLMY